MHPICRYSVEHFAMSGPKWEDKQRVVVKFIGCRTAETRLLGVKMLVIILLLKILLLFDAFLLLSFFINIGEALTSVNPISLNAAKYPSRPIKVKNICL